MPTGPEQRYDFFLSRRGSVAAIAREVADVLTEKGYKVLVQDYDAPTGESFVEMMHEAVKNSRDLVILFTRDYEQSPYTRKEFTSFEAERAQSQEERHIIVLRCEDAPIRGLLADNVYQDLVGIGDADERRRRIIAAAERQSQAAPAPPPGPFMGVPPRIASFTGRSDKLDRIDALLIGSMPAATTQSVGRAAVQGMGGVGKTSLAVEYAHRYRKFYAGVCWCSAETISELLSSLAALAVTLGVAAPEEADVQRAAKAALRRLGEQRATWLLVYDNASSPNEVGDFLPSSGARLLITTRFSDFAELAEEVILDVLPHEEAVQFLQIRTGRNDAKGAQALANELGHLPLALDHAAAFCKRTQMSFADYATRASSLIDAVPRGVGYPKSVAATFDLAITQAVAQCPTAEILMAFLAQCAPVRIPMALVEGAVDKETERLEALAALAEVSLVKHDPFEDGTPAITVHRLVQAVGRVRSESNRTSQRTFEHLVARLSVIYPRDGYNNSHSWPLCAHLTPHVLATSEGAPELKLAAWPEVLNRAGSYFHGRASFEQAKTLFEKVLAIREKVLGREHPETAKSLLNLGGLLQDYVHLSEARPLLERALSIREKVLGSEHPETARSLNNLARLLRQQGDLAGARPLYERALAIYEKVRGPTHPHTARSINNLARLLEDQGDLAAARLLFERALAVREKAIGNEHPDTAKSLNNLAHLLQAQGEFSLAQSLFERALAIREKKLGPEHPETARSLNNLATLLQAQGNFDGALQIFERALSIRKVILGTDHPETARSITNLARLLHERGDLTGARLFYKQALEIRKKKFGPDHPEVGRSLNNVARLLKEEGDLAEARQLHDRALAIFEKALGPKHPETARTLDDLGRLFHAQNDFASARSIFERALAIRETVLGPNHPETAKCIGNLARLLRDQADYAGAQSLYQRALTICEKVLGPEHGSTNLVRRNLARLFLAAGKPIEALALAETTLAAAHDKGLGCDHGWTKDSASVAAEALDALGRNEEAAALRGRYGITAEQAADLRESSS
jgi:tetratricopeptide (TPR) repeat protein